MSRFEHVLRRLDAELETPEPTRTRALLEIGGDLEAAYEAYRSRGLGEAEAVERAAALLGVTDETARELSRLHTPVYAAWLGRITARPRGETRVLTVVALAAAAASAHALHDAAVLQSPGAALWLLYAAAIGVVWNGVAASAALLAASGRDRRSVGVRVSRLAVLSFGAAIIGGIGGCAHVWQWTRGIGTDVSTGQVMATLGAAAEMVAMGLTIALCGLLAWFHLYRRLALVEDLEAELQRFMEGRQR